MELEQIRAFLAVIEHGSVSRSSRALGLSRATVRRWLEELEASAGTALMIRTPFGIVPTVAGELLASKGRQLLHETEALVAALREVGHAPTGTVRIALPVGLPPRSTSPWRPWIFIRPLVNAPTRALR